MNNSALITASEKELAAFAQNIDAARILTVDGENWSDAARIADLLLLDQTLPEELTWVDLLPQEEVHSVDTGGGYSGLVATEKGLTTLLRHSEHPCALSYLTFIGVPVPPIEKHEPSPDDRLSHFMAVQERRARHQYLLDRAALA